MNRSLIVTLITVAFVIHGMCEAVGFCDYPTYYDSDGDECVLTCPSGTIGNVSRTANPTMRNCTSLSPGYNIAFNATEYEFDVSVFTPVETDVFEALLFFENRNAAIVAISVGNGDSYGPFKVIVPNQVTRYHLIRVILDEALDPNDDIVDYNFNISYVVSTPPIEGIYVMYNGSVSVILHEIDNGCHSEQDSVWNLNWPFTEAGSTAMVECPNSAEGQAYRYCQSSNLWEPFINVSECQSSQLVELEEQAVELKHLIADDILTYLTEVEDVSEATTSFIFTSQEQGPILPNDLIVTNSILDAIICILDNSTVEMVESDNTESILESVSSTIDHLLNDSNNIRTSYQESDRVELRVAEDLLRNAENFARTVGHLLNTDNATTSINITKDNFMLRAELVPDDPTTVVFTDSDTEVTVTIPASALVYQRSIDMEATNIQVVNFIAKNLPSYLNDLSLSNDDRLVTSLLVSSQISDYKVDLPMNSSVELMFGNLMLDTEDGGGEHVSRIVDPVCVFWNFSLPTEDSEATGGWSSDGIIQDSDPSLPVVCKTTHLTSFSVLVTTEEPAESGSTEALSIVSYIGCGVSIACLLLTIVVIILLRKVLIETKIYVIHFNLSIALLLTLITFVSGIETATDNKEGCIVVATLLHYFLLATFCWMLCEGIKLFMMLMFVFYNGFFQKLHFFLIVGWGAPIPFVVIPAVLLGEDYHDGSDIKVCWISNAEYAIWTFVAPAGLIILVNIVFMIIALIKIHQSKKKATKTSSKILTNAWTILWGMMILMPLLGISWILGLFFIIDSDSVAFTWIFTIVNSLQGAVIFYLHILRNDRIKTAIHEKYTNWKKMKALQTAITKDTSTLERPPTDTNSNFILRDKPTSAAVQLHAILESKTSYDSDIASPVQPYGCSTFFENKTACDSETANPVHDEASMDDDDNNRNEVLY